jgi:hypothetical protein
VAKLPDQDLSAIARTARSVRHGVGDSKTAIVAKTTPSDMQLCEYVRVATAVPAPTEYAVFRHVEQANGWLFSRGD